MKKNIIIVLGLLTCLLILVIVICLGSENKDAVSSNSVNEIIELDIYNYNCGTISDNPVGDSEVELGESKIITIDESTGEIKEESIITNSSETPIIAVIGVGGDSENLESVVDGESNGDDAITSTTSNSGTLATTEAIDDERLNTEIYINDDGEIVLPMVPID